ncbi:MAG: AMP-binding protein, partial [Elusimicrobiota bacterium]
MNDDITITKLFLDTCNKYTDRTALQLYKPAGIEKYSYRQIKESALKIAEFLKSENTGTNNFVAIILDNCPEWSMIYFGIVCAGMCAVPIDSQLTDEEKENLISDCGTKIIFTSDGLSKIVVLAGTKASRKSFTFKSILSGRITAAEGQTPEVKPEDIASLIYTSGTTAKPKGVCLTHYNLCSNFLSIQKLGICKPEDNIISILPLYHTYSFMVTLLVPFFTGAVITYPPGLKSDDLINTLRDCKVTILVGVPQLFYLIHKAIFSKIQAMPFFVRPFLMPLVRSKVRKRLGKSLALLVSGGARLEPEVARDFVSLGFKFTEGYGLTETSPVVTFNPPGKPKFGSVGKTIPDVEIKIYNPDKSGIGEVLVNGPNVMKGYFNRPDLTAEVIKDRWFYTGDLGYIDSDGYLYIAGRKKDVIVLSSGKNIYPEE